MQVKVQNIFNTTIGTIATLDFPPPSKPTIGMALAKGDCIYTIKGVTFEQPNQTEGLENTLYSCLLSTAKENIVIGDILEIV